MRKFLILRPKANIENWAHALKNDIDISMKRDKCKSNQIN
jgi:hypothetical protein